MLEEVSYLVDNRTYKFAFHLSHNLVLRELGLRGLYKGSSITMMRDIPYFMIFFPLNHALVDWFTPKSGVCPLSGLLLAGCGAGMTSAFLSKSCLVVHCSLFIAIGLKWIFIF